LSALHSISPALQALSPQVPWLPWTVEA